MNAERIPLLIGVALLLAGCGQGGATGKAAPSIDHPAAQAACVRFWQQRFEDRRSAGQELKIEPRDVTDDPATGIHTVTMAGHLHDIHSADSDLTARCETHRGGDGWTLDLLAVRP